MAKYKLASGFEFDVKPAPIDDSATDFMAFLDECKHPEAQPDTAAWGRKGVSVILKTCCPEAYSQATLFDLTQLMGRIDEMTNDAWGGPIISLDKGESKNA